MFTTNEKSAEEIAQARLRIRERTRERTEHEADMSSVRWAALNDKGLRKVYDALPELLPGIENTKTLEWACAPDPVSLEKVQAAFNTSDLLSKLILREPQSTSKPTAKPPEPVEDNPLEFVPEAVPESLTRKIYATTTSREQRRLVRQFGADALNKKWAEQDAARATSAVKTPLMIYGEN